jgi:hypothetical protein
MGLRIGMLATCLVTACASAPEVSDETESDRGAQAREEGGAEDTGVARSELAQCDWDAQGRAMDRFTAMCRSWGYDQGVFRWSGCIVTLDHCIEW